MFGRIETRQIFGVSYGFFVFTQRKFEHGKIRVTWDGMKIIWVRKTGKLLFQRAANQNEKQFQS